MGVVRKYGSKNYTYDPINPKAYGVCDYSGFRFRHCDLVKQKDWRGDNFVWTGLMVGPPFVDKPQPQNRPSLSGTDPKPVKNPRPNADYIDPNSNPVLPNAQLMNKLNNFHWDN